MNRQSNIIIGRGGVRARLLMACAVLALAGCEQLAQTGGEAGNSSSAASPEQVLRVEERDIERPDIFNIEARALWDGRFSLGGRWIAVARDVKAERVKITNLENGREVEGALFKTEVERAGPPIMVSMDAAEALGMQAGAPTQLRAVVLRRESVEVTAPVEPLPTEPETAIDPAAPDATETPDAAEAVAATPAAAPVPVPAADASSLITIIEQEPMDTSAIETAVLQALDETPAAASGDAPARPRIQVASGTNQEGAEAVSRRLAGADIPAEVTTGGTEDAPIYRVIAGPFASQGAFDAALEKLRELGYADAFPTS
ncbi:MAG: SPOR domain-containing protein [Pseudomonadota bacterium]